MTKKESWILLSLNLLILLKNCQCEVIVTDTEYKIHLATFHSVAASFGQGIPENGFHGVAMEASPKDGCSSLMPPPDQPLNMSWIAVIKRYGGCTFEEKVRNAQDANFSAVIIYNLESNKVIQLEKVIQMGGQDDNLIPSVFIGYQSGKDILKHFTYIKNNKLRIILTDDEPFDINAYLLPFAIVVGICFLIMLAIVIFKCIQDHRRRMRHRLPKSALKKLPIHKFKSGDPYETCCICLDDFEEGDKLRILPCDHAYHSKCIDSWLVKHKRICPQCRKRVFERGTGYNSSDSEDNERAPLLGAAARPGPSGGGTFGTPGVRPSTSAGSGGILDRLQASGSTQSDSVLAVNERRLLQHRRFRRPTRLRRVYEVLSESTTSSDNENPDEQQAEQEGQPQGAVGGPSTPSRAQVGVHQQALVVVDDELQTSGSQKISAEVHVHLNQEVHVHSNEVLSEGNEDESQSPEIYAHESRVEHPESRSRLESDSEEEEPSLFVRGSNASPSSRHHRPENA